MAAIHLAQRRAIRQLTRCVGFAALFLAGLSFVLASQKQRAAVQPVDEPAEQQISARFIRIPLPITGNVDTQVKRAVQRVLEELAGATSRPVLVFEFGTQQHQTGERSDFGRALALARYLSSREVSTAKTVAFLPQPIKGHAVLVAMACEEIVMAPDATIGEAGVDESTEEAIDPTVRAGYREIANRRRTIPPEVALGMLDKDVEVLKVETEVSPEYVLRSDLEELGKKRTIQSVSILKRAGELARFTGREARELGFVKYLASDVGAVAKALSLPRDALEADPSLAEDWRPILVPLKGAINSQLVARVHQMIEDRSRHGNANFICLWIDSPGGSLSDSMTLANYLADLDSSVVRTVAYIPREARGDAALIAVACDQIVMHPGAVLGGPGEQAFSRDDIRLAQQAIRDNLAPKKSRSWSLSVALIDQNLQVYRYTHHGSGLTEYLCEEEANAQADADQWARGPRVNRRGESLRLNGEQAEELGVARHLVNDFAQLKEVYHLKNELVLAEPGWADFLIDALAEPGVAWVLLLIGGAALYAELQAPGIGFGAFVAGLCFLLYFWSKFLDGTAGWLEVLLFVAGVACVLLEVFVLPGTIVFGLGGGLLVLASLILASQTFVLPQNQYQVDRLRDTLLSLAGAGAGIVVLALFMRKFLPHTPMLSSMMLEPPSMAELEDLEHRESVVDFSHLLGQHGTAVTQLAPSGKARFDNQLVDVIADDEVVSRGTQVVVVSIQGNRVIVRSNPAPA